MSEDYRKALVELKCKLLDEANAIKPKSVSVDCDFDYGKIAGLHAAMRIIDEILNEDSVS